MYPKELLESGLKAKAVPTPCPPHCLLVEPSNVYVQQIEGTESEESTRTWKNNQAIPVQI